MKTIVLFDPSQGTRNLGDFIIRDSINKQMGYLLDNNYVIRFSTHMPICKTIGLIKKGPIYKTCKNADYKFIGGTNIFKGTLLKANCDWAVDLKSVPFYSGAVAIGCGLGKKKRKRHDLYTRIIYRKILSKDYYHSARDEKTKKFIESLGLRAINTGCPTMWSLTPDHCKKIPKEKATKVVFTLTDYSKDLAADQKIINALNNAYKEVYYWPQGAEDMAYFSSLERTKNIKIIGPNLESYRDLLDAGDIDYVGTRLHGGIYAMQHFARTIIIIIDNRARDIKETYGLNTIERTDVDKLEDMINSSFETRVKINEDEIKRFKAQFVNS